jgi:protein arginine N-methyltransferase 5
MPGAPLTNSHNTRSATVLFSIPHAAQCHGLAGYFEAHLYGNIGLSTHPETAHRVSPDMFSWFPLFFPFKSPLYLPTGSELEVNIWRLCDQRGRKVWYEWCAEVYLPTLGVAGGPGAGSGVGPNGQSPALWSGGGSGAGGTPNGAPRMGGLASPLMDAPFSPGLANGQGQTEGRIKIGQTSLHNPGGISSWVGL